MQQGHQLSTYNSRRSLVKEHKLGFASSIRRKDRNTISEKQVPNYQPHAALKARNEKLSADK
jgi:hypothetical protein